jgi:hypothetical protein
MMMSKQITALKQAAIKKQEEAFSRANLALKKMISEKSLINFEQVALKAKVSKNWLYNQAELRKRIESLRSQQRTEKPKDNIIKKYEDIIVGLKTRIKIFEMELKQRDTQIEALYGKWFEKN